MKRYFLLLIMTVAVWNGFAQEKPRPSIAEKQALKMKTELSLTADQFVGIKGLNEKFRAEHDSMVADTTLTKEEVLVKRKQMMKKREEDLKEILTEEQYSRMLAQGKPQKRRPSPRATAENSMAEMKEALGLTDEQVEKIGDINARVSGRMRQLRTDTTMTRESTAVAMKEILGGRKVEIKKLLTEEQYEKFLIYEDENRRNRRGASIK